MARRGNYATVGKQRRYQDAQESPKTPATIHHHKPKAALPAHQMVQAGDTHRLEGTVLTTAMFGEYIGSSTASYLEDAQSKVAQSAWDKTYEANIFRKSEYTHLSDLMGKCHRMLAITKRYDVFPSPTRIFDQNILMFAMGNMLHDEARRRFAAQNPEQFYGFWRCLCHHTCVEGTRDYTNSIHCEQCAGRLDEYVELRVIYHDLMVGHSIDALFMLASGALRPVEIKSCTKEAFESYKASKSPAADHLVQVMSYWRALRTAGYNVDDKVSVFYVCKEYISDGQALEIVVPVTDRTALFHTKELYESMELINEIDFNKPLPPRQTRCADCFTSDAKYCQVTGLCFALPNEGYYNGHVTVTG